MRPRSALAVVLAFLSCATSGHSAQELPVYPSDTAVEADTPIPRAIHDPLEPLNRTMAGVNHLLMRGIIQPTSYPYRYIVRRPIRVAINQAAHNAAYPMRLVNNLLQGKWEGAREETGRFLANSTVGLGGLLDVATGLGIGRSDEDFGQTLAYWGWRRQTFLMLPARGPSSMRDGLGGVVDSFANPATYYFPISLFLSYNQLTDQVERYNTFVQSYHDPYSTGRDAWAWYRASLIDPANLNMASYTEPETAAVETLRAAFAAPHDPAFPGKSVSRSLRLNGRTVSYTLWMQPKPGPVLYFLPGLGDHRLGSQAQIMAEIAFFQGYSIAALSGLLNHETIRQVSSTGLPGDPEQDARDTYTALEAVHRDLHRLVPGRIQEAVLMGVSMGGFQTLYLAARPELRQGALQFESYLALNPPVDLVYGLSQVDEFKKAPLEMLPPDQRNQPYPVWFSAYLENILKKGVLLVDGTLGPESPLPFTDAEAKFIIGGLFRLTLRDAIHASQSRNDLGLLENSFSYLRRERLYNEILDLSFTEYLTRFVNTHIERNNSSESLGDLTMRANLKRYTEALRDNPQVYLIGNENDFLLSPADLQWLMTTFPEERRIFFPRGGHLGNLHDQVYLRAIATSLRRSRASSSWQTAFPDELPGRREEITSSGVPAQDSAGSALRR